MEQNSYPFSGYTDEKQWAQVEIRAFQINIRLFFYCGGGQTLE